MTMQVQLYHGERYERSPLWFVLFFLFIALLLLITIFSSDLFGAILILFVVGAYFYSLLKIEEPLMLVLENEDLNFAGVHKKFSEFSGFFLEGISEDRIETIGFVTSRGTMRYSFFDTQEKIQSFVQSLSQNIPYLDSYTSSFFQRLLRKLKI